MASHFDDLDRRKLDELVLDVKLLIKMVARHQDQLRKMSNARKQATSTIRYLRTQLSQTRKYVRQLELTNRLPLSRP